MENNTLTEILDRLETSARTKRIAENERLAREAAKREEYRRKSCALFHNVAVLFVAETIDTHARENHDLDGFCLDPASLEPFVKTGETPMPRKRDHACISLELPEHMPIHMRVKWDAPNACGHIVLEPIGDNWIEVETGTHWSDIGAALDNARDTWDRVLDGRMYSLVDY